MFFIKTNFVESRLTFQVILEDNLGSSISRENLTPKLLCSITESLAKFSMKYENVVKDKNSARFR